MKLRLRVAALMTALLGLCSGCTGSDSVDPAQEEAAFTVYCFQAGKADAFLLCTDGGAVLIDTGESGFGKTILAYLEAQGITRLDYLIITHFDKDHVGGAKKILNAIEVGTVLQSNCPKDASAYNNYAAALDELGISAVTVREPLSFTLGGVQFAVDPPVQETYDKDPSNNSSLIVSAVHGENRLLFAGDAQDARLTEFLQASPGRCQFLKVPYHGHWQETLPAFFAEIAPTYAVITSSDDEPEDAQTVAALELLGAQVFLTRTAPVLVRSDGQTLTVSYTD